MLRVVLSLLVLALGFAALAFELNLGRATEGNVRAAVGIFVGILGLGYPLLCYCCRHGWWQAWRMILLGALTGLLCSLPFLGGPFSAGFLVLTYVLFGAGMGLLFWLGAIWRNLDLTCPKSFCLPCGTVYRYAYKALRRQSK